MLAGVFLLRLFLRRASSFVLGSQFFHVGGDSTVSPRQRTAVFCVVSVVPAWCFIVCRPCVVEHGVRACWRPRKGCELVQSPWTTDYRKELARILVISICLICSCSFGGFRIESTGVNNFAVIVLHFALGHVVDFIVVLASALKRFENQYPQHWNR